MAEANKNATKATEPAKEKVVTIRIPRSRDNQDDVFVGVNGRTWLIKRGVEVEVPECVAEVIRNSEEAAEASYAFSDSVKK
jgi:hypothetical protein